MRQAGSPALVGDAGLGHSARRPGKLTPRDDGAYQPLPRALNHLGLLEFQADLARFSARQGKSRRVRCPSGAKCGVVFGVRNRRLFLKVFGFQRIKATNWRPQGAPAGGKVTPVRNLTRPRPAARRGATPAPRLAAGFHRRLAWSGSRRGAVCAIPRPGRHVRCT